MVQTMKKYRTKPITHTTINNINKLELIATYPNKIEIKIAPHKNKQVAAYNYHNRAVFTYTITHILCEN